MLAAALLLPVPLAFCAPASRAPAAFAEVLERRGVAEEKLAALGLSCSDDGCRRLDAAGHPVEPDLSPEDLDVLLARRLSVPAVSPTERLRPVQTALTHQPRAPSAPLNSLYDGQVAAVAVPEPPAAAPPKPSSSKAAVAVAVSAAAADKPQPNAEKLEAAARELYAKKNPTQASAALRRELTRAANLDADDKPAFAARLQDPLTVYVAFSRSRAPHAVDAGLYFARMTRLLGAQGKTLSQFIAETDPKERDAAQFLLRAHAYDVLIPYLNKNPDEAGETADLLFPERPAEIRAHADQLEGLFIQLAARGRASGALASFLDRLQARAEQAPPAVGARVALFVKLNESLLPRSLKPQAEELAKLVPPGLLEDAGLVPPSPAELWPADKWTFALHFASTSSFTGWIARFEERGFSIVERGGAKAVLAKDFGGPRVELVGLLHPGDEEGFLRGAQARQFLAAVSRELKDSAVQGVILRNHAQFPVLGLFTKLTTPGKLMLDGSCRSAWDLQSLRRRCPTCSFVVNTGTGFGRINNAAVAAVIEGLAEGRDWGQIGESWARAMPRDASRMQGPWTPDYAAALEALEARERQNNLYSAKPDLTKRDVPAPSNSAGG